MGARITAARIPRPDDPRLSDGTYPPMPWAAQTDGATILLSSKMGDQHVVEWLKMHFPEALHITVQEEDGSVLVWKFKGFDGIIPPFMDAVAKFTYGRTWTVVVHENTCILCGKRAGKDEPTFLCATHNKEVFG